MPESASSRRSSRMCRIASGIYVTRSEAIMPDINQTLVNKIEDDEPGINSTVVDDQEEQMEIFLEPDLEQFTDAVSAEIAEGNNEGEVTDENMSELNSSVVRTAEDEEKTEGSEDEGNEDISASTNFDDNSESKAHQSNLSSAQLLEQLHLIAHVSRE